MEDDEVDTVFPLPVWFVLLAAIIVCLPGCVRDESLPLCERYDIQMAQTPFGPLFLLDHENMQKLATMVQGLNNRTCRLEKPKPETKAS